MIKRCVSNFSSEGALENRRPGLCHQTITNPAILEKAIGASNESPNMSVRRLAQQLGASVSTTHPILTKMLSLFPYKVQVFEQLQDGNFERRVRFRKWLKDKADENPDFLGNLPTSDGTHFSSDGSVKRQHFMFRPKKTQKKSGKFHSIHLVWHFDVRSLKVQ